MGAQKRPFGRTVVRHTSGESRVQVAFNFAESVAFDTLSAGPSLDATAVAAIADVVPSHRRHCRILFGSVPAYQIPSKRRRNFALSISQLPARWRGYVNLPAFIEAFAINDLCAIVVDGISPSDAAAVDERWHAERRQGYLGAFQLLRGDGYHEALYLMSLPPRYHVYGTTLDFLVGPDVEYGDGDYDSARFDELAQILPRHGIETVRLRSTGATGTFFDPYETNNEFARTAGEVERLLGSYTEGIIAEITLRSRESDPRLLEVLHAALDALERDAGKEFLAQAALSCRRFLERLANVVYPPRAPIGDRKLGKEQYVNRLWMYLEDKLETDGSETAKKEIGARVDYLARVANKGLHGDVSVDEVHRLVLNLALLTRDLLSLTPPTGQPSESYASEQRSEFLRSLSDSGSGPSPSGGQ